VFLGYRTKCSRAAVNYAHHLNNSSQSMQVISGQLCLLPTQCINLAVLPAFAAALQAAAAGLWSAAAAAAAHSQAIQGPAGVQLRSLAQIIQDNMNPAVATRTTNTTAPGASPAAGSTAADSDSNPAVDPRTDGQTAPASNTSAGSNSTANPAVDPRTDGETAPTSDASAGSNLLLNSTANETLPSAGNSSTTQVNNGQRGSIPLANCPAGQMALGAQCVPSNAVGAASSGAALRAVCDVRVLQWLASTALLAVVAGGL
jgi:hypothetical protein